MSIKILIVYSTLSGSTMDIARTMGSTLEEQGAMVDVLPVDRAGNLKEYGAVIMSSPIVMGKVRRDMRRFIMRHRPQLRQVPIAMFITCLRLTVDRDGQDPGFPVYIDSALQEKVKPLEEMNFMEKSHRLMHYCNPLLEDLSGIQLRAFAVFKGALDYGKLDFPARLFMRIMSLIQDSVREGNYVNHAVAAAWAKKFYLDLKR